MLIALPNLDGSFTCTLFLSFQGAVSFDKLQKPGDLLSFFARYFPDVIPLMPTLVDDFFSNPTGSLVTVKCFPWHVGHAALIGDAAHAIVPFYGQGMNAGFEDCTILDQLLDEFDWPKALDRYQDLRKPNADALAELAFRNFVEMRDKVADEAFMARKKLFTALQEKYPAEFMPVYSMVTFSSVDYASALAQADLQDRFYERIQAEGLASSRPDENLLNRLIEIWRHDFGGVTDR
jgi:kynurenine 3-monooxygenase